MLLAYIDEIGSTGAFIHPNHRRFSDSPAFGYGGFIIPEENARELGAYFAERVSSPLSPKASTTKPLCLLYNLQIGAKENTS